MRRRFDAEQELNSIVADFLRPYSNSDWGRYRRRLRALLRARAEAAVAEWNNPNATQETLIAAVMGRRKR